MKLFKLLVPVLALGLLAGCGEAKLEQSIVDAVSEIGALLTSGATGTPYSDRSMTINIKSGDTLVGTTSIKINQETLKVDTTNGVEVTISYAIDTESSANWVIAPGKPDAAHARIAPKIYDFEDYTSVLTATIAYGETTKAVSWNISVAQRGYELVVVPLGDVREEVAINTDFTTRGYLTGFFKDPTHVYAGAVIADGESAINLNRGQLGNLWAQDNYQIGDLVLVTGKHTTYNGVHQLVPTEMVMDYAYAEVSDPVDLVINSEAEFSAEALDGMDSRVIRMNNLVYVSGKEGVKVNGSHASIIMKFGTLNITLYVNYHISPVGQQEFIDVMADWVANETTVNYHGHLGWYTTGPQLTPFDANVFPSS